MSLEMHIVMKMSHVPEHHRDLGVLGFLFIEDDTVADIPLFTEI